MAAAWTPADVPVMALTDPGPGEPLHMELYKNNHYTLVCRWEVSRDTETRTQEPFAYTWNKGRRVLAFRGDSKRNLYVYRVRRGGGLPVFTLPKRYEFQDFHVGPGDEALVFGMLKPMYCFTLGWYAAQNRWDLEIVEDYRVSSVGDYIFLSPRFGNMVYYEFLRIYWDPVRKSAEGFNRPGFILSEGAANGIQFKNDVLRCYGIVTEFRDRYAWLMMESGTYHEISPTNENYRTVKFPVHPRRIVYDVMRRNGKYLLLVLPLNEEGVQMADESGALIWEFLEFATESLPPSPESQLTFESLRKLKQLGILRRESRMAMPPDYEMRYSYMTKEQIEAAWANLRPVAS